MISCEIRQHDKDRDIKNLTLKEFYPGNIFFNVKTNTRLWLHITWDVIQGAKCIYAHKHTSHCNGNGGQ